MDYIAILFIFILGSINHFVYNKTKNPWVAYFVSCNESTFEHLKLIILPTYLWYMIDYHHNFMYPNFYFALFISLLISIIIIPVLFYGYHFIFKKNNLVVDILIFLLAIIIGRITFNYYLFNFASGLVLKHISMLGLILIFILSITLTYTPLKNFLFKDPITKKYGI